MRRYRNLLPLLIETPAGASALQDEEFDADLAPDVEAHAIETGLLELVAA